MVMAPFKLWSTSFFSTPRISKTTGRSSRPRQHQQVRVGIQDGNSLMIIIKRKKADDHVFLGLMIWLADWLTLSLFIYLTAALGVGVKISSIWYGETWDNGNDPTKLCLLYPLVLRQLYHQCKSGLYQCRQQHHLGLHVRYCTTNKEAKGKQLTQLIGLFTLGFGAMFNVEKITLVKLISVCTR